MWSSSSTVTPTARCRCVRACCCVMPRVCARACTCACARMCSCVRVHQIDSMEFHEAMRARFNYRGPLQVIDQVFSSMDLDGDGTIGVRATAIAITHKAHTRTDHLAPVAAYFRRAHACVAAVQRAVRVHSRQAPPTRSALEARRGEAHVDAPTARRRVQPSGRGALLTAAMPGTQPRDERAAGEGVKPPRRVLVAFGVVAALLRPTQRAPRVPWLHQCLVACASCHRCRALSAIRQIAWDEPTLRLMLQQMLDRNGIGPLDLVKAWDVNGDGQRA